jgi:hypothetical protein
MELLQSPLATLAVYLSPTCWICEESSRILQDIIPEFPNVAIDCFNINGEGVPDKVFAAPTYILNGKIIYLGNPTRDALRAKLAEAINQATGAIHSSAKKIETSSVEEKESEFYSNRNFDW